MKNTVLIVIDIQTGAFDGKEIPPVHAGRELLQRVGQLIAAARTASIPVFFIQHCAQAGQLLVKWSPAWALHPSIQAKPNERVIYKRQSSAFDGTDLQQILENLKVDTLVSCGIQSEFCLSNTCIDALDLGINVFVAADAHSTLSTDDDDAETIIARQNIILAERGATVQKTTDLAQHFSS